MRIECFEHFEHFKFLALGAFASGLGLNAFESCLFWRVVVDNRMDVDQISG